MKVGLIGAIKENVCEGATPLPKIYHNSSKNDAIVT